MQRRDPDSISRDISWEIQYWREALLRGNDAKAKDHRDRVRQLIAEREAAEAVDVEHEGLDTETE